MTRRAEHPGRRFFMVSLMMDCTSSAIAALAVVAGIYGAGVIVAIRARNGLPRRARRVGILLGRALAHGCSDARSSTALNLGLF